MKRYSRKEIKRRHIPQELINEILLRLPVKSLVRFKSVCKSWLSLISDPHFALSHFELAAASTERLALSDPFVPEIRSIDFSASLHDDSASAALKLNFLPHKPFYVRIQGSCRGFLLLNYNRSLCVWNPSTGVHKFIHRSPIFNKGYVFIRGFGYDPSTDDYLVVQSVYNPRGRVTRVEYFSVRANAWKGIEATHFTYKQCSNHLVIDTGLFFNGAIHWLSFCYDISIHVIVAFDVTERSFSKIPLPVGFQFRSFQFCLLRLLGELLNLCAVRQNNSAEIWAMKEYKVQSSWTKTIVVSVRDFPTKYFFPIRSTKNGDIVGRDVVSVLVKCNDKGQLQEHRYYGNGPCTSQVVVYTESLLSLPCDSEQAEEDD